MSPNDRAVPAGIPNFWKKRTSSASRAADDGSTSEMNWMEYCSIRTGKYRSRASAAPRVAPASAVWMNGESSSAATSHTQSADASAAATLARSTPASIVTTT